MTVEIRLFGGLQVLREGRPVPPMALRSSRILLGYLVIHRDRLHTRDRLIGTFWPEHPESYGRRQLRQALYQLRKPFDDDTSIGLATPGDDVGLARVPGVAVDVDEFEWALDRAAGESENPERERALLETAVELYRGELLDGYYEDWIYPERDRLHRRLSGALQRITDLALAAGDHTSALDAAHRRAEHDPFDESAHRRVMEILALLGRHDEAIRRFDLCSRILADDIGAEPSAATFRLYEEIRADRDVPRGSGSPAVLDGERPVPFVDREDELLRLTRLLDALPAGRGGVVLIEGEPGVGKTRLLEQLRGAARWRGIDVLAARMVDGGSAYAPLAGALAEGTSPFRLREMVERLNPLWLTDLAPLVAGIGPGPDGLPQLGKAEGRDRTREAFVQSLITLASLAPTLLAVDDVHLADRETLAVLGNLAGRIQDRSLLLILSYRHAEARARSEVWNLLCDLEGRPGIARIGLAPLSPARTEELVRMALAPEPVAPELSDRIHRRTGGVPLLIIEILRALAEGHDHSVDGVGASARDHLRARLETTDPAVIEVLECLAIAEGGLTPRELAAMHRSEEAVESAVHRGLVARSGSRWHVAHGLLREVLRSSMPASRCLELHRDIAMALREQRPEDLRTLAGHFEAAAMPEEAADYLEAAAVEAHTAHALDDASDLFERALAALDAIGAPPDHRYEVASALERILDTLGERDRQLRVIHLMEDLDRRNPEVLHRRAHWLLVQDRIEEAEASARAAVAEARRAGNRKLELAALTILAKIASLTGRTGEGARRLEAAVAGDRRPSVELAEAHRALGQNLIELQRFEEAESSLHAALAVYGESGDRRGQADVLGTLGILRLEQGDTARAESALERAVEDCVAIGYRRGEATFRTNLGILLAMRHSISKALDELDKALRIHEEVGSKRGLALVMANKAWLLFAWLGDAIESENLLARAEEIYESLGDIRGVAHCKTILGAIAGRRGNPAVGERLINDALALIKAAQDRWLEAQALRELGILLLASGDPARALDAAFRGRAVSETAGLADISVDLLAIEAWSHLRLGRVSAAIEQSTDAVTKLREGAEFRHLVLYVHSLALRSIGQVVEADRWLTQASHHLENALRDLPVAQWRGARESVPISAEICTAANERQPRQAPAVLARGSAPTGRAPRSDELVRILWTIWDPEDDSLSNKVDRRRHVLVRLVREANEQGASPTIPDLAEALHCSVATTRRDLAALRSNGVMIATRGSQHE